MLRGSVRRAGTAVSFNYLGLKIRTDPRTFHECRLARAKRALDQGLVTQEGYDAKKAEILADF